MLKQRILTAVVALVALAVVLFVVPAPVARSVIAILFLAGAWEWGGLIRDGGTTARAAFIAGSVKPTAPNPPTRIHSRRVTPSHNFVLRSRIESMVKFSFTSPEDATWMSPLGTIV